MDDVDEHYLDSYLNDILPALGLDVEAYGPYVTSFVSHQILIIRIQYRRLTQCLVSYLADERG